MNVTPADNDFWRGIGGHFDTFTQIICEFIDNSISNFEKYESFNRNILITIDTVQNSKNKRLTKTEKANSFLKISIEDTGTGMSDIPNMFKVGDQSNKHSILNEHGFGLKHALAAANPTNDKWRVSTRTIKDLEQQSLSVISAPYNFENLKIKSSKDNWTGTFNGTGTLVEFECSQLIFSSVNKGKKGSPGLFTQLDYLCEDLGYIYSGMIKEGKALITVHSNNILENKTDKRFKKGVKVIEPVWAGTYTPGNGKIDKNLGGGQVEIDYKFGEMKESLHHKYYKKNMATSGVEIRINGRLLASNLFYEIWNLEEHPSYNKFLAIINLISDNADALPTTKTAKNGIKTGDAKFEKLIQWIKEVHPQPQKKSSDAISELELVNDLAELKRKQIPSPEKKIETQLKVYKTETNCPVAIDLYVYDGIDVIIYEAKKDNADLQSLYQLLMYWDGAVNDGLVPTKGILLASSFSKGVDKVIELLNSLEDRNNDKYNFSTKTWIDEGIMYPEPNK